jgi:hypothetical protein
MLQLEYMHLFDVMYISDCCESSIKLNCKMHVVVVACKLYMNS